MAEKNMKARIVHKHDIEANWLKATNFIPMKGEIIVYDIDNTYDYERLKIGDGASNVNDLPFYANSWNDLSDKPFGEVEDKDYLVAERSIKLGEKMNGTETYVGTTRPYAGFVEGETYYIVLDGTVYPAQYDPDEDEINVQAASLTVSVYDNNTVTVWVSSYDPRRGETHTFGLYTITSVTAQLDEQYIPDTIARVSDVEVHNTSESAHSDIRAEIGGVSALVGDTAVSEQISAAAIANQSDWSVNNESNPAYVKNRPFHESDPVMTTLLESQTISFVNKFGSVYMAEVDTEFELSSNATYKVTWDSVEYSLATQDDGGSLFIGDIDIAKGVSTDGRPPFLIITRDGVLVIGTLNTSLSHTISIICYQTDVTTLPNKFLSSDVLTLGNFLNVDYTAGKTVVAEYGLGEIFNDYANNKATGSNSHAEGYATEATNYNAHAEGSGTVASGHTSHAEGATTTASGQASHAEGYKTKATGWNTHAEGQDTEAVGRSQHVQGEYNIVDKSSGVSQRGKYVHIVGNGNSANARSNAHTLDWIGNAWFKGTVKVGGTGQDDTAAKELATQEYVDIAISEIPAPDVSGQIETHNASDVAHSDIRNAINNLSALVGDTSVSEQISAANMIYVGPNQPTDPNIKVWINVMEDSAGAVPVLPRITTITLLKDNWTGNANPYSQVVSINTVTSATKVDLQPTAQQIVAMQNEDIALMAENNAGTVTIYALGGKPSVDYTMQVLLMEVSYV